VKRPGFLLRGAARGRKALFDVWKSNSGDWRWLREKPTPLPSLNRLMWRDSVPSLSYVVLLSLASVLSTLGLLSGSTATVIGAMIVAPLMGPIVGMSYALAVANRRLLKRASLTLTLSAIVSVASAAAICLFVGLRSLNPEIMARTEPTLIDLVVAMAAGAAGAFTKSRQHIANAFPGVAIAVALVPPLSAIGIGLVYGYGEVFWGALLLFVTNLAGTIFSGILILLWQEYGSLKKAQRGIIATVSILAIVGIPLGFSLRELRLQANARQQIESLIRQEVGALEGVYLRDLQIEDRGDRVFVEIELAAPGEVVEADLAPIRAFLDREVERPVSAMVRVIPLQEFEFEAATP